MADPAGNKPADAGAKQETETIQFHYIKSNYFRTIHADGAWGGITPRKHIHASFYSERQPIPRMVVHQLMAEGALGEEIRSERITKDGMVREIEVEIIFDMDTAKAFRKWLDSKIKLLEKPQEPNGEGAKP